MEISRFLSLFVFCIHVMLINSAGMQLRLGVDYCSTDDIKEKLDNLNDELERIKKDCIDFQRLHLIELVIFLTSSGFQCSAEVSLRIGIALEKLEDALTRNCDIGVRGESSVDNTFRRIIAELESCVKFSNGCSECDQRCCFDKRYEFYRNIDADINALIERYTDCISEHCGIVITVDIFVIKDIIRDCNSSTTTTTEVTSTPTATTTTTIPTTTKVASTTEIPNTDEVTTTVDEITTVY